MGVVRNAVKHPEFHYSYLLATPTRPVESNPAVQPMTK